jgi:putative Mg2+ transporter-C (MgtC) family protein
MGRTCSGYLPGMVDDPELALRIVIAACVGAAIGLEREVTGHEPGIRTHALVAVGAAVFSIAGAYGFADQAVAHAPSRVAAQVATGIGFIGAGAVMRSGATVRGLTTAASLWVSAGLGVAAAAGMTIVLAVAMAVTLAVLVLLRLLKPWLMRRLGGIRRELSIEYERGHGTLGPIMRELEANRCTVGPLRVEDDDLSCLEVTGKRRVTILVRTHDEGRLVAAVAAFEHREEILAVAVTPPPS